ncbi:MULTISPECIES: hypothetical protein [Bradyrhizobium]|jgi:hypothetical protein|uniref:Uncharacterized protein n=1 Tax=Bradyrhizobium elkanii TaxID=29448 RepID=A0ABV4F8Y0_BRAEL|nr:hypothetical protein [Bradyrhizobium elkanii]MCP1733389.1 hypothetical protein [Bradyrhizobium elkanii]MCP1750996.1 hypothetical protein [Bradyrhizobium elkanii]MCP1976768.1 hypothetical protein [Bradyrhizobium elkanii]MCS3693952.1 hypothetical protein [Bradyrhizobium elkanii]MCS3888714.1 hypothetical protein [Bradyrhizobium elkanii]
MTSNIPSEWRWNQFVDSLYRSRIVIFVITSGTTPPGVEAIAEGTELLLDEYRRPH